MESQEKRDIKVARLQFRKYILLIIGIWVGSWYPMGISLFLFYNMYIKADLPVYASFGGVFSDLRYIVVAISTPFLFIVLYLFRLVFLAFLTKIAVLLVNRESPPSEMVAATGIGENESRMISAYWARGAILRLLKWSFVKSPFPWLATWAFNFVGVNKFGKNTVVEDGFLCQEFLETENNVYIGPGSIVSSHLVEGSYGAITLKKIKINENAVLSGLNGISPGCLIERDVHLMPMSGMIKFSKTKPQGKYLGVPIMKVSRNRYRRLMKIPAGLEEI